MSYLLACSILFVLVSIGIISSAYDIGKYFKQLILLLKNFFDG